MSQPIESDGTTVLVDPDQPLQLEVSITENARDEREAFRWLCVALLPCLDSAPVWIDGSGPTHDEALRDLIRLGTELRVAERQRARAKLN